MGWTRKLRFPWQQPATEDKQEIQPPDEGDEYRPKIPTWIDYLIWDIKFRIIYVIVLCVILGIVVPILYTYYNPLIPPDPSDTGSCVIDESLKFRCLSGASFNVNESSCTAAGCCWNRNSSATVRCFHTYPSRQAYEILTINESPQGLSVTSQPAYRSTDPFGERLAPFIHISIRAIDPQHLVIRFDSDQGSLADSFNDSIPLNQADFNVGLASKLEGTKHLFKFEITRKSTGEVLLGTSEGPLFFGENYAEFSTLVPTKQLYGLSSGLDHSTLSKPFQFERDTLFIQDPSIGMENTGYHPFYMAFEKSGLAHGLVWDDSHPFPLEVEYLSYPALAIRAMGRMKSLQLHLLAGPTPMLVSQQYKAVVSEQYPSVLPPYWQFGLGLCRESLSGSNFEDQLARMQRFSIPFDSDCIDLNLYRTGFDSPNGTGAFNGNARVYRENLTKNQIKFNQAIPPYLSLKNAEDTLYPVILNPNGTGSFLGSSMERPIVYVDFASKDLPTVPALAPLLDLNPDGLMLIDNVPVNKDQARVCDDDYPFVPLNRSYLEKNTICMTAVMEGNVTHLSGHNIYGRSHVERVFDLVKNESKRIPLLSESSAYGNRGLAGTWVPDSTADWASLRRSLVQVLETGLMGIPWVGMPICGTLNAKSINTTAMQEILCLKWYQVGLLMPFAQVISRQNQFQRSPADFSGSFARYVRGFMRHRYSLLPYYYTLSYQSAWYGIPIIRPLFYEFPGDNQTFAIQEQFMIGSALLACPSLYPNQGIIEAYFPQATWYDCFSGDLLINATAGGSLVQLASSNSQVSIFLRSGTAYVTQDPGKNAELSRNSTYTITAALGADHMQAEGYLYVDDGISNDVFYDLIHFWVNTTHAELQVVEQYFSASENKEVIGGVATAIGHWRIMGFPYEPHNVTYYYQNTIGRIEFTYLENQMLILDSNFDWSVANHLIIQFN